MVVEFGVVQTRSEALSRCWVLLKEQTPYRRQEVLNIALANRSHLCFDWLAEAAVYSSEHGSSHCWV